MKARRIFSPRPPAAVRILMRRIYGDSAYMRSTTSRRLRMCKKARATAGVTPCQTEQECEVPNLCMATGGCERMEPVCSWGCPSTEVCKARCRRGPRDDAGVQEVPRG